MTSINISIKKEAYDFLNGMKSEDKSFSDVILSFKKDSSSVMEFFGCLKGSDWDGKEKRMKEFRNSFEKRF